MKLALFRQCWKLIIVVLASLLFISILHLDRTVKPNKNVAVSISNLPRITVAPKAKEVIKTRGNILDPPEPAPEVTTSPETTPGNLPPCGDVCSYKNRSGWEQGLYYPQLTKIIQCDNIMRRMAYRDHVITYPPPENPPDDLYDEFTQFGECSSQQTKYYNDINKDYVNTTYNSSEIADMGVQLENGEAIGPYTDSDNVLTMLRRYKLDITDKSGLVIGTLKPWVEVMLLAGGARHITTLEYGHLVLGHPNIDVYTPFTFAELHLKKAVPQYDFAVSFSSLEHAGLGRYGDPINPYGDMEAMAQVWCLMKPGGLFVVGVPGNLNDFCKIDWNAHRVYGTKRLKHLTANWEVLGSAIGTDAHVTLALRKI